MAKRKPAAKALDDDSVDDLLRPMKKETASSEVVDKELLVTSSLLDSIDFYVGCPIGNPWKEKALADLKGQLSRAPWSGENKFTKRGMAFEAKLCTFIKALPKAKFLEMMTPDCICEVEKLEPFYDYCKDGKQQAVLKESVEIDGQKFCLYGKADIFFPGKAIQDIKTTSSEWKEDERWGSEKKYRDKNQHIMYAVISQIKTFNYLVAQFVEVPQSDAKAEAIWKVIDVHVVDATIEDLDDARKKLYSKIRNAMTFLRSDPEMWSNYTNVFTQSWQKK